MPRWTPVDEYKGSDVYIIGGGPSLESFDWALLKDRNVIGCNAAFTLGAEICPITFFSDTKWYARFGAALESYKGRVVSNSRYLYANADKHPDILCVARAGRGLFKDKLCFGYSSGAAAINLALLMGAGTVYLLGFDCKNYTATKPNWHECSIEPPKNGIYEKFIDGFNAIAADLPVKFPNRQIINLGPDSVLKAFPKQRLPIHFPNAHERG